MPLRLPTVYEAPRAWALVIGALSVVIFFTFVYFGEPGRGGIACFSFIAIACAMGFRWEYRDRIWFWVIIGTAASVNIALIFGLEWAYDRRPAMVAYAPLAVLQLGALVLLINLMAKITRS